MRNNKNLIVSRETLIHRGYNNKYWFNNYKTHNFLFWFVAQIISPKTINRNFKVSQTQKRSIFYEKRTLFHVKQSKLGIKTIKNTLLLTKPDILAWKLILSEKMLNLNKFKPIGPFGAHWVLYNDKIILLVAIKQCYLI